MKPTQVSWFFFTVMAAGAFGACANAGIMPGMAVSMGAVILGFSAGAHS